MLLALIANAHAKDDKVSSTEKTPLGFTVVSVTDNPQFAVGIKLPVKDFQQGVFITATGGWNTTYPKTTQLLKDIFKSKGIKIVEKPDDAAIGLMFRAGDNFGSFEEVENDLGSFSHGIGTRLAILMSTLYTVATHGNLSSIRGNEFGAKKNSMADVLITIVKNPKLTIRRHLDGDDKKIIDSEIEYHLDRRPENDEHFASILLKAGVTQFIDQHFEGLRVSTDPGPASGIATVSRVATLSVATATN